EGTQRRCAVGAGGLPAGRRQAGQGRDGRAAGAQRGRDRPPGAVRGGGRGGERVRVQTVGRLCRKVVGTAPRELYGEGFERAWQQRGKRVNERVQAFDHCFSSPKSVSLLAAG